MTATPIISGLLYSVRGCGIDWIVLARTGCDAIIKTINQLEKLA